MPPAQNVYILLLRTQDSRLGTLTWFVQWAQQNHRALYKFQGGRGEETGRCYTADFEDRKGPPTLGCG